MRKQSLRNLLIAFALVGVASLTLYWRFAKSHNPDETECPPISSSSHAGERQLVFEIPWGTRSDAVVGLHKATFDKGDDFDYGFKSFYVAHGRLYLADPINKRVIEYSKEGITWTVGYSFSRDEAIALSNDQIYVLAQPGDLVRISRQSGQTEKVERAVREGSYNYMSENTYRMSVLDALIIIDDDFRRHRMCFDTSSLRETACPERFSRSTPLDARIYFLPGHYALVTKDSHACLFKDYGELVGTVSGLGDIERYYDINTPHQVSEDGVYYVGHTATSARIYFRAWLPVKK